MPKKKINSLKKKIKSFEIFPEQLNIKLKKSSDITGYKEGEIINAGICFFSHIPPSFQHSMIGLYRFYQATLLDPTSVDLFQQRLDKMLQDTGFQSEMLDFPAELIAVRNELQNEIALLQKCYKKNVNKIASVINHSHLLDFYLDVGPHPDYDYTLIGVDTIEIILKWDEKYCLNSVDIIGSDDCTGVDIHGSWDSDEQKFIFYKDFKPVHLRDKDSKKDTDLGLALQKSLILPI